MRLPWDAIGSKPNVMGNPLTEGWAGPRIQAFLAKGAHCVALVQHSALGMLPLQPWARNRLWTERARGKGKPAHYANPA